MGNILPMSYVLRWPALQNEPRKGRWVAVSNVRRETTVSEVSGETQEQPLSMAGRPTSATILQHNLHTACSTYDKTYLRQRRHLLWFIHIKQFVLECLCCCCEVLYSTCKLISTGFHIFLILRTDCIHWVT